VPGVADAVKNTQLRQEQVSRQSEMSELLRMVKEGRIREANERQLETLQLALQLNQLMNPPTDAPVKIDIAPELVNAIKEAVSETLANSTGVGSGVLDQHFDGSRPTMKHTMLGDLEHTGSDLEIKGEMKSTTTKSDDKAAQKLERLKQLKKNG
jgi:hypothetical protein